MDARQPPSPLPPLPGAGKPFRLEIATLSQRLFGGAATYIELPGASGYLGVLHGHAPLLALMAPGTLTFHTADGQAQTLAVPGGIAEVAPWGVAVLIDLTSHDDEAEQARMERARAHAAVHLPHAQRPIGAAAVRAELDAELVRFFANALKRPR